MVDLFPVRFTFFSPFLIVLV